MAKIAVFDSGFGSLSIIRSIQKTTKSDIIYFADQKNYPYGIKTKSQLSRIIKNTIDQLNERFSPDVIVVASNTPSVLLPDIFKKNIIGVFPPLSNALKISKTKNIAILATKTTVNSVMLSRFIKNTKCSNKHAVHKINASPLVDLVESGKFIKHKTYCKKIIKIKLVDYFTENNIDTCTLSSTHLPFLLPFFKEIFPNISFLDPAELIASKIKQITNTKQSSRNSLKIFSSNHPKKFENYLKSLGIKNKVISF